MNKIARVIHHFFKAIDPPIGKFLLQHQMNHYVLRMDGRTPDTLHLQDGLPAILNHEKILQITQSRLQQVQEYHLGRLGLGATSSYSHLYQESAEHAKAHANQCIYGLYAPVVHLPSVNQTLFGESAEKGYEKEYLILESIPLSHILFATTPKYRADFEQGLRVPNEMATYHVRLPHDLTKSEVNDFSSTLRWLLNHGAESIALKLCKFLSKDKPSSYLSLELEKDETLMKEVQKLLSMQDLPESFEESDNFENYKRLET